MKKLVLAALLAGVSSAGCTAEGEIIIEPPPDETFPVTVRWDFTHLADGSERACPTDFRTATVVSQQVDANTHRGNGQTFQDKFDCSAGQGTVDLDDDGGVYLVWVEIENTSGSSEYAKSFATVVDSLDATHPPIDVEILDDGGYFFLTWDLEDAVSGRRLSCNEAGITGGDTGIATVATDIANQNYFRADIFDCEDHYGTTDGLLAATYTVSIDADDGEVVHKAPTIERTIQAPNKLTDLGNIIIPID